MSNTDTTARPQQAFLRFIDDGLTFEGQVWRAGAVCATKDLAKASIDPLEQRRRWGVVMFEVISEEEYLALKDIPAQNLRATRRVSMTPPPPSTAYNANGEEQGYDEGKAAPIAMAPAQVMSPPMLVDASPEKQAKYRLDALNSEMAPPMDVSNVANMSPPAPPESPWDWYDAASDMATIGHIAGMGEAQIQEFLAFERANKARPAIIKVIETGEL